MKKQLVIRFLAEEKVVDIPWEDLSGMHFHFPGWWDNTVILYHEELSRNELQDIGDWVTENCFIDGKDWEDYETGDGSMEYKFDHPKFELILRCELPY